MSDELLQPGLLITTEILRRKGASCSQLVIFSKEWPEGAEVNLPNLLRVAQLALDLCWFANYFLPDPLWEEYDKKEALLKKEYHEKVDLLWEEYVKKEGLLWEKYLKKVALLIWELIQEHEGGN